MCYSPPLLAGFRCRWWWAVPATPGWGPLAASVCGVWRWCVGGVVAGVWCGLSLASPGGGSCVLLPATPGWVSLPLLVGGPRHSWLGSACGGGVWCVVCGVWRWCVGGVVAGVWCGWSLATPGGGSCVLLPATPGWVSLPVVVGGPRHSWLGSACGGGVWCVVCGGGVLVGLWLVCGVVGPSPLLAEVPVCYSPPLLAGFRCRWWWAVPATPVWGPLAASVCGVWRWCVGGVVAGVWCGWSLASPGGGPCVLLPATPGWVSLPVVVGGPRHSWLRSVGGGGVWCVVCGVWCVVGVPRHSWRRILCATPRLSWLGFAAGGGGRSPPLLAGVRLRRWCVVCVVWCVVCGGGVLAGLWLVCGVVGPSPLLAEVPVCYSPPLLAGFRCRWWWAVPATPGWGPLAAVVCGVWFVAVVCWWGCCWCVVWLVPRHSWRRFLCATPRHSWLGFAAAGGGRSPPLLAGVRLRRRCVVCGGGVLVGLWLVCVVVGPSPLLAEVPVCYSPPLLAGFRCRWWWAVPATPGWGLLAAVVCGVWCVVCGVLLGSLATPGGGSCVLLPATPGWVSLPLVVGGPRHSWLGSAGGGGVRALLGRVGRAGLPGAFWCASPFPLAALSFCFAWPPPGWGCPSLFRCCCLSLLAGVCGVCVGCCLAPVRVPWFVACCARSPGLWHPAAVAAWQLSVCLGCGRRRASLACLVAPRGAPRLVRSGRSRCSGRLSPRRGAFPHPGSLRPRLYWAAARGTRRPAENRAHCACRWPPPRQGRWARSASYPFGAPRWGCPWRVPPASVLGCVRCGGGRVWTRSLTRPVSRTVRLSTGDSAGAPGLFRVDADTSPCGSEDATPGSRACLRVLALLGRVGRAGLPGAFGCASPFPLAALSFCFAWPPPGWGCPSLFRCCCRSSFVSSAWPLAALWWLLPRPPPLCGSGFRRSWCGLGVFFFFLSFFLFFFFFFLPAPPLSPAFSGFRPRVPWASARALFVLLAFRFSALRALVPLSCFPPGCSRVVAAPPPPLCLAVFVPAARCCVPCCAVRPPVRCCAALLRVVSPGVVLSCAVLRSFCAAACCAVPSGAARRSGALCSAALCFAVFLRAVCSVLCVFCRGAVVRAVVRRSDLCCVCLGVLCCAFPVLSVLCGAVLRCAGALALCCSCGACCCWRLVLWCAAVCCAVSCGVPWCGAGSGGPWLSAGGVFRCRCPCLAAWSASLWLVWFAVVPCFPVSCSVVLCCRGAVLLCSAVVLRCCWGLLCPPVGRRAVLCCAVGWLCCFWPGGGVCVLWCSFSRAVRSLSFPLCALRCLVVLVVVPCFPVSCAVALCCRVVLCCRALLSFCGAVCVCFALLRPVVGRLCRLRCCWCLVLWRVPVRCGVSLGVLRCGGAALVCRGILLCCALSCGVLRSVPCPAVPCCPAVLCWLAVLCGCLRCWCLFCPRFFC